MPTASTQTSANAPFLKTAVVLWLLALCGVACVLPFALSVQGDTLNALAAQKHMDPRLLLAASLAQSVLFIGGAVFLGLWSARKIGLGAPLFSAWLYRNPLPAGTFSRLLDSRRLRRGDLTDCSGFEQMGFCAAGPRRCPGQHAPCALARIAGFYLWRHRRRNSHAPRIVVRAGPDLADHC